MAINLHITRAGYKSDLNPYFGATVGRYANRIGGGSFQLDGKTYILTKNMGNNQLHGGLIGFDKVGKTDTTSTSSAFNHCEKNLQMNFH